MMIKNLSKSELLCWLQLSRSVGEMSFYSLLELYKTAKNALAQLSVLQEKMQKRKKAFSKNDAAKELALVERFGAQLIAFCENKYSDHLRVIKDSPPILTVKGNVELLNKASIAIVGSRNATINSCNFAHSLASELSQSGYVIISGLASGVDTAALKIIDASLPVIAVIGTGIDKYYPIENLRLQDKITENGGLVVTEIPFGQKGQSMHFARRNRIISGLSEGVMVIEASENSGSLITARRTVEQGRYLFASPGAPYDKRFSGTNRLLKQGAILVENAQDIIKSLKEKRRNDFDYKTLLDVEDQEFIPFTNITYNTNEISNIKSKLVDMLEDTPVSMTQLEELLDVPGKTLLLAIVELEIEEKIVRTTGGEVSLLYNRHN